MEVGFLNGEFLNGSNAKVALSSPGFLCGYGIFETMRSYNGRIVYLEEHLKRFNCGLKITDLKSPYGNVRIKEIIKNAVSLSKSSDAYVRLTLWKEEKGSGISVIAREHKPYPCSKYLSGMRMKISTLRADEGSILTRIKSTSRLLYELSFEEARDSGFDGSIILNSRGYLAEASRSNIFFIKDKILFTPDLSCGCLPGITRKAVLDLARSLSIEARSGNFTVDDLIASDEAFLTNSLAGVIPIASVDNKKIGKKNSRPITCLLSKEYNCLLK